MRADLKGAFSTFAKSVDYDVIADAVYSGDYREVFKTIPIDSLRAEFSKAFDAVAEALVEANQIEAQGLARQLMAANPDVRDAAEHRAQVVNETPPPPDASDQNPTPRVPRRQSGGGGRRGGGGTPTDDFATMEMPPGGIPPDKALLPTIDNDRVLGYIGTRSGELIQNVTADLQANVQNAVAVGMTNNLSPRQVAGLIRDNLPLNNRQQGALDKYKKGLSETKLPKRRQRELVERMRNAYVDERATTIARTETQYAINRGMAESWQEAQRQGLIGYNSMKRWQCEAEPCAKICEPMSGKRVRINDMFELPNGTTVYTSPAHVNCRCNCVLEPDS